MGSLGAALPLPDSRRHRIVGAPVAESVSACSRAPSEMDVRAGSSVEAQRSTRAPATPRPCTPNGASATASDKAAPATAADGAPDAAEEVARLRRELETTRAKLARSEERLSHYRQLVQDAVQSAVFSADANERYRAWASSACTSGLLELPQVTKVKYVRCSFPSLPREAPAIRLHAYRSLSHSEWNCRWAPSWSLDVCVEGYHYLYFELSVRVTKLKLAGRLMVDFVQPLGVGGVRIGFADFPSVSMDLESEVNLGFVPVPIQDQIADIVRVQIDNWLTENVVAPRVMHFSPFGGTQTESVNTAGDCESVAPSTPMSRAGGDGAEDVDEDVQKAIVAAMTHRMTI